ncbi:Radical SAM protein, partial [human gut metagenome]
CICFICCKTKHHTLISSSNKGLRLTVSTSILVPKPFTPFQWAPMARIEDVNQKINAVKDSIKSKCIVYNYHEQKTSVM